jgi:lipase chaperone LimK
MLDGPYDFDIPDELKEVAARHQQHIAELVFSLRSAGMDDHLIERSVDQLIGSYKAQLLEAIKALGEHCRA